MYENFLTEFNKAILEAGRYLEEIELIAVSKKKSLDDIKKVHKAGHFSFGENQIQEIENKWIDYKKENKNIVLHYVGSIQSRKTTTILDYCDVIHSVDRLKIIKLIKQYEENTGIKRKYFLQINTGNEPQKSGILLKEADSFIEECTTVHDFNIFGLMCLPPINDDPSKHFNTLRDLASNHNITALSMGMSHDYKEAIKCGATHVRIGTSIFGARS